MKYSLEIAILVSFFFNLKTLTYDVDGVRADDGLGELLVDGVADGDGLLRGLADGEGDVGAGDPAALLGLHGLGGAVDGVDVEEPLDLRGRIRDVGPAVDGHLLLGPRLRRPAEVHLVRRD